MNKRNFKKSAVCAAVLCGLLAVPVSAHGATPEEAAEVAREYGYSESQIQEAYNEYYAHSDRYDSETIDNVIAKIRESGSKIVSVVPEQPDAVIPALTAASATETQETTVTAAENIHEDNSGGNTAENPASTDNGSITVTLPDGSEFTRISQEQFIALSYDDKMTYLSSFSAEQQQAIIDNLSPEEYKSIMKQLPTDQKMEVIGDLSEVTDTLGLTLTVDSIDDNDVKVSMKNSDGELLAVTKSGLIENTGYDRRGVFAAAGLLFMAAFGGIVLAVRKCFGNDEAEDES